MRLPFERANALALHLESLESQSAAEEYESNKEQALEAAWSPSVLLTEILVESSTAPLSFDRASRLIGSDALRDLCEDNLLRVVFDRVALPWGVSMALHRSDGQLEAGRDHLVAIRDYRKDVDRGPIIEQDRVRLLRDRHAQVFPKTPSIGELEAAGALAPSEGNYAIRLRQSVWSPSVVLAAIRLWPRLTQETTRERLRVWLDLLSATDAWIAAPRRMLPADRDQWIEAAVAVVLDDADIQDWSAEFARTAPARRHPHTPHQDQLPDESFSAAERYRWWHDVYHLDSDPHSETGARAELLSLAAAIIWADPLHSRAYKDRGTATKQLILGGADRPVLSLVVPDYVFRRRPSALSWLLLDPGTSGLAMHLLLKTQPELGLTFGSWEEFHGRSLARQRPLLDESFALFFEAVGANLGQTGVDAAARGVIEVLAPLSRRASTPAIQHTHALAQQRWDHAALELGLSRFSDARLPSRITTRRGSYQPTLLNAIAKPLLSLSTQLAMDRSAPGFMDPPLAITRILIRLMMEVPRHRDFQYDLNAQPVSAGDVATAIVDLYATTLSSGLAAKDSTYWVHDHAGFADQAWEEVAVEVLKAGRLQGLLESDSVRQCIARLGEERAERPNDEERRRQQTTIGMVRLHLRILLKIYNRLPRLESQGRLDANEAQQLRDLLEDAIADVVSTKGSAVLFERQPLGAGRTDLAELVASTLNRFPAARGEVTYRRWLDRLRDPLSLLAISEKILSSHVARLARERLLALIESKPNLLDDALWLPELMQLAEAAALANETELASKVLDHGAQVTSGRRMEADWEEVAFRVRLILAYQANDLIQIRTQTVPGILEAERSQKLERSRRFYEALALLDSDAQEAESILTELSKTRPIEGSTAVNIFAARIRRASEISKTERAQAFADALSQWNAAKGSLPEAELERVEFQAKYNMLAAMDGAGMHDAFDDAWRKLAVDVRSRPEFVSVAVRHYRELGRKRDAEEIVKLAWRVHASPTGEVPDDLDEIAKELLRDLPDKPGEVLAFSADPSALHTALRSIRELSAELASFAIVGLPLRDFLLGEIFEVAKEFLIRRELFHRRGIMTEDQYTDVFVSLLRQRLVHFGWGVRDQSRGGKSGGTSTSHGAGVGERDLVVSLRSGEVAVLEALRLSCVDSNEIRRHLDKLLGYDPVANPHAYVMVYYTAEDLEGFVQRYVEFVTSLKIDGLTLDSLNCRESTEFKGSSGSTRIRVFRAVYDRSGNEFTHDHIVVHCDPRDVSEPLVFRFSENVTRVGG